ncbi:MAG: dihydropteroate synthase [Candidatus Neomarinimicrobiota bacterium]|nr:MAG: dihydropteroate synthase [Candidatus Neomarinimicrobiota bacterium]
MGKILNTQIMGILNVTPDSFSDGGLYRKLPEAVVQAEKMIEAGADIIDIGGESTRPGSEPISLQEEMDRVLPVLDKLADHDVEISIDTTKPKLAHEALKRGADIINDIYGLQYGSLIAEYVAKYRAKLIIMHMKGIPKTMQLDPDSKDIIQEITNFFKDQSKIALEKGVKKDNIILDPGIGFGKRLEDNIRILKELKTFQDMGFPLLLGASRKSMIGDISGAKVTQRLPGSLAIACVAAQRGVDIIRVHDVAETVQALKIIENIW